MALEIPFKYLQNPQIDVKVMIYGKRRIYEVSDSDILN